MLPRPHLVFFQVNPPWILPKTVLSCFLLLIFHRFLSELSRNSSRLFPVFLPALLPNSTDYPRILLGLSPWFLSPIGHWVLPKNPNLLFPNSSKIPARTQLRIILEILLGIPVKICPGWMRDSAGKVSKDSSRNDSRDSFWSCHKEYFCGFSQVFLKKNPEFSHRVLSFFQHFLSFEI